MFENITTDNGSQKPTPRIILGLLAALIPIIWGVKDQLLEGLNLSPILTNMIAASATVLLIFLADQFGIELPGRKDTPKVKTPRDTPTQQD